MNLQSTTRERISLGLLAILTVFLYADQNLMAPNLSMIASDFGLSATERDLMLGGQISFGFFLIGGLVAIVIGRLADRLHRVRLLTLLTILGELPCAATLFVETFEELFVLRMLTGIAIGGAAPLTYSLVGDMVGSKKRPLIAGLLLTAVGCGILCGQLLAGFIGESHGWRLPFVLVALPNIALAILFGLTTREPTRGARDSHTLLVGGGRSLRSLLRIESNRLLLLQGIAGSLPWAMIFVFLNDYLAQDCGLGIERATIVIASLGLSALVGAAFGGIIGSRLYSQSAVSLPWICTLSTCVAPIPLLVLLNLSFANPESTVVTASLLGAMTGLSAALAGPNLRAMLLNINPADSRGSMMALATLTDDLGKGLGPAFISLLIVSLGRTTALHIATLCWVVSALIMLRLVRSFPRDEHAPPQPTAGTSPYDIASGARPSPASIVLTFCGQPEIRRLK